MSGSKTNLRLRVDHFFDLSERLNLSLKDLSAQTGLSVSHLGHLKSGRREPGRVNIDTVNRIAAVLRVPPAVLLANDHSSFIAQRWSKSDRLEFFYDHLKHAHNHLVISERIDGYCFPTETMWRWGWTEYQDVRFFNPQEQHEFWTWSEKVVERQKKVRHDHDYIHRVICPAVFFEKAMDRDPKFIEDSLRHFRKLEASTSVEIVPPGGSWVRFHTNVANALMPIVGFPIDKWDQISVVNDYLAVIRVESANYITCYDPNLVSTVLNTLSQQIRCFYGSLRSEESPSTFEFLDELLRNRRPGPNASVDSRRAP